MNGVLLKDNTHEKEVYISDCIPLFHQVRDVIHTLKSNICSVTVYNIQYIVKQMEIESEKIFYSGFDFETNVTNGPSYNR